MKTARKYPIIVWTIFTFIFSLGTASVRAEILSASEKQADTETAKNVRIYSAVPCVTTTAVATPDWEIRCGLFPLKQTIGLLMERYIQPPDFMELAQTAFRVGAQHIDAFKYREDAVKNLDIPFESMFGAGEDYMPDDWQMERLAFALLPLIQKLRDAHATTEIMGPRAFELLLKETRDAAIAALIEKLHPHTDYYALGSEIRKNILDSSAEMQKGGKGFGGIGAALGYFGSVYVQMPFPNTPAGRSLKRYDEIIAVDGVAMANPGEAAAKIRGEAGKSVTLSILRNGEKQDITLTRENIKPQSATGVLYAIDNIAICYLFIGQFIEETDKEIEAIFADGGSCAAADTYVLDLRSNGGGFVGSTMGTAQKLLPKQTNSAKEELLIQFKSNRALEQYFRDSGASLRNWKVRPVILQGPGSASGSEIVIGALKPHVTLVGDRTFGKFSAFERFVLTDGAILAITSNLFSFQDGIDYDGRGFFPDVPLNRSWFKKETAKEKIRREENLPRYLGKASQFSEEEKLFIFLGEHDPELAIALGLMTHPERFFWGTPEKKGGGR